jgi:hypothetical protein
LERKSFIHFRRKVREGTGTYAPGHYNDNGTPNKRLPLEERYSARFFELKDVFIDFNQEETNKFQPTSFHNVDSWDSYREFMKSDLGRSNHKAPSRLNEL